MSGSLLLFKKIAQCGLYVAFEEATEILLKGQLVETLNNVKYRNGSITVSDPIIVRNIMNESERIFQIIRHRTWYTCFIILKGCTYAFFRQ